MEEETYSRHRRPETNGDRHFKLRNILNIIFMIGAIVGMAVYFCTSHTTGTIIIMSAMIFKVAECCLRFIR